MFVVWCLHDPCCVHSGLTRDEECERILRVSGDDHQAIIAALDRQFRIIHNRAQVLLAICGVLLSTSVVLMTGKIIGRAKPMPGDPIGKLLIAAGATEIAATAIIVGGVLNVRWMSQLEGRDLREWIGTSLRYRDGKTHAYRLGILLVLISMILYQSAVTLAWLR